MSPRFLVAFILAFAAASALAQQEFGRVLVIHAFPTGQVSVDIFISKDGFVVQSLTNVPYMGASDWFYLPYGSYIVGIRAAGGSGDLIPPTTVDVEAPSNVIFAADDGGLILSAFADNINSIDGGDARVTIAHWAVGVGSVDVGVGSDFTALANNLGYGSISTPVSVEAGDVSASLRLTGETEVVLTLNATLESQKAYLVVAVGVAMDTPEPTLLAFELTDYSINARLAFVHGIPAENLPVNVVANGALDLFRNVVYKGITDYKNIPAGIHTITVENMGTAAITVSAFFNGFSESTLYATTSDFATGVLLADNNAAPDNGEARLRVLHGTGAASAVDVLSGSTVIIENLAYLSASAYLPLPANNYSLSVNSAGTQSSVFTVTLPVAAGPVITVVALGDPSKTTGFDAFTLLVVTDATYGAMGNLRAVHAVAVAGAPTVNIKANGANVFTNVPYKAVSSYIEVDAGLYKVSVHAASGDSELFRSPIRVDAAGYFSAIAGGNDDGLALFQLRDNEARPATGNAHLRVVHASATSPEVNLEVNGDVVGSLIYTEAFGYIPVPEGTYVARVTTTQGNTQVFNGSLPLEADTVVSVFAVGVVGDNTNGFTVVPTIDFDFRTPTAGPSAGPTATPSSAPTATPTRTPTRTSSAAVATASFALMALAAIL